MISLFRYMGEHASQIAELLLQHIEMTAVACLLYTSRCV